MLLGLLQAQILKKHILKLQFQLILYIYSFYSSKLKNGGTEPSIGFQSVSKFNRGRGVLTYIIIYIYIILSIVFINKKPHYTK